jgi:hypothetical protein
MTAVRKHRLIHRIRGTGAQPAMTPLPSGHPAVPGPQVMPLAEVLTYPAGPAGYSMVAYRELVPIWAPAGEAIPARSPGRWGQLRAAGRP